MLKTTVYVSDINNLSDARYCAGMMVDYLAFNIDNIGIDNFREITSWIEGEIVAEFNSPDEVKINEFLKEFPLDYIAINGSTLPKVNAKIIAITNEKVENCYLQIIDRNTDFASFNNLVLVSGDFKPSEIDALLEKENVKGICLKGGDELRPGQKDFDEFADILEYMED